MSQSDGETSPSPPTAPELLALLEAEGRDAVLQRVQVHPSLVSGLATYWLSSARGVHRLLGELEPGADRTPVTRRLDRLGEIAQVLTAWAHRELHGAVQWDPGPLFRLPRIAGSYLRAEDQALADVWDEYLEAQAALDVLQVLAAAEDLL